MKTEFFDPSHCPVQTGVVYKRAGDAELRLHVFESGDAREGGPRPAIVFFFGGGWRNGKPDQFFPQCRFLASRRMVAISAEYRTHSAHGVTPRECVQDARSCLRWIRSHADEMGIDPNRLAAGGGSAGGHLAASTALNESFDEVGEDLSIPCRPDALVLFNPVLDSGPEGYGHERVENEFPRISPAHNVCAGWPPTLIMVGTVDEVIPVPTMEQFHSDMLRHQNHCELVLYPGASHGFFNYERPDNSAYYDTLKRTESFLLEQKILHG